MRGGLQAVYMTFLDRFGNSRGQLNGSSFRALFCHRLGCYCAPHYAPPETVLEGVLSPQSSCCSVFALGAVSDQWKSDAFVLDAGADVFWMPPPGKAAKEHAKI